MPEIVEVEIQKEGLAYLIGQKITDVEFFEKGDRVVRPLKTSEFSNEIVNKVIKDIFRIGKYIVFNLGDKYLTSHLAMTGSWIKDSERGRKVAKHKRLSLKFESGEVLNYNDTRIFGRMYIENDLTDKKYKKGVDALKSSEDVLKKVLMDNSSSDINIKYFLTNQKEICGLGNVYANEILFISGIHPKRTLKELSPIELNVLAGSIKFILMEGYHYGGLSMRDYFHVDGSRGLAQDILEVYRKEKCIHCEGKIEKSKEYDKRTTYFCNECQK